VRGACVESGPYRFAEGASVVLVRGTSWSVGRLGPEDIDSRNALAPSSPIVRIWKHRKNERMWHGAHRLR
jgi:hypothetical protein